MLTDEDYWQMSAQQLVLREGDLVAREQSILQRLQELQDPVEIGRARAALHAVRRNIHAVRVVQADNRRKAKHESGCAVANAFVDICRDELEPEDFKELLEEAKAKAFGTEPGATVV